jgi:3-oxoacyl-[acyl-carrier protein] reductase
MDLKMKGKRALIAASSRGLGYACACALASEGAWVAINGRDPEQLLKAGNLLRKKYHENVITIPGDVSDPLVPGEMISKVITSWGGLDILITNAGGPPPGLFINHDDYAWDKAIELSLMSHVRLIRFALPHLLKSNSASVLTITSISVKQPIPNLVLSNSIRAATAALTKSLALELGDQGIRFNSILPAWTMTERVQELLINRSRQNGTTLEEETRKQASDSPFNRLGTPEEFANVAAFLVSPAASYVTGVLLTVDGGTYRATI